MAVFNVNGYQARFKVSNKRFFEGVIDDPQMTQYDLSALIETSPINIDRFDHNRLIVEVEYIVNTSITLYYREQKICVQIINKVFASYLIEDADGIFSTIDNSEFHVEHTSQPVFIGDVQLPKTHELYAKLAELNDLALTRMLDQVTRAGSITIVKISQ
jgi:hypothetical protein